MNKKLLIEAIIKYLTGIFLVGILLFLPAGSFHYWNGWLFMELLFIPMFFVGIFLMIKNKELLRKRLNGKERIKEQKNVIFISGIMFLTGFITSGLNYRYQWITLSNSIVIISSIVFLVAYLIYMEVLRENTYLSRTIEVEKDQKVITTGLYKIIRHPMYLATILLFLSIPFILGSPISFFIFLIYPLIIIKRIINEESVLEKELKGYKEYQKRTKYRLIPFVW